VRAVAILSPFVTEDAVRPFELPGVSIFTGNELDPTDEPDAALIFGGDGTVHRHLGTLALRRTPTLAVRMGSANDFAATLGIDTLEQALAAWKRFCETRENARSIDLGTIQQLHPVEAAEMLPALRDDDPDPWEEDSMETLHFVPMAPVATCRRSVRASNIRRHAAGSMPSAKPPALPTSLASRVPVWMPRSAARP
jgi:hypothetical protein